MESFLSLFDPNQPDDGFDEEQELNGTSSGSSEFESDANANDNSNNNSNSGSSNHNNNNSNSAGSGSGSNTDAKGNLIFDFEQGALPPEPQLGNVEYKLKLVNPSKQRFEHLVTQMKWRLREGHGEAIYEIGVSDAGHLQGLSDKDMNASLTTLKQMAHHLGASTSVLRRKTIAVRPVRSVAEVLVRKIPDDQHNIEVRVAVLGGADAGKSTLLGVLTQDELDNGHGRARLNMFRHMHEIQSGKQRGKGGDWGEGCFSKGKSATEGRCYLKGRVQPEGKSATPKERVHPEGKSTTRTKVLPGGRVRST